MLAYREVLSEKEKEKMSDNASFFYFRRIKYINKPFNRLPFKKRAVFILHLAGFSSREIERLIATDYSTITRWIKKSYEEYDEKNATFFPIIEGC